MPVNLNALVRYKTIDSCLRNQFLKCTIDVLINKCSAAVSDYLGEKSSVSERTIRNDIRVLRSDILGFNAPIECKNGIYQYTDEQYSIYKTSIAEKELLIDLLEILVDNFDKIDNEKLPYLLESLARITGKKIPRRCGPKDSGIYGYKIPGFRPTIKELFKTEINDYLITLRSKRKESKKKFLGIFPLKHKNEVNEYYSWYLIFDGMSD